MTEEILRPPWWTSPPWSRAGFRAALAATAHCYTPPVWDRDRIDLLAAVPELLHRHGRVALCQVIRTEGSTPGKAGWRLVVTPDGSSCGNLGGGAFEALVAADAADRLDSRDSVPELKRYYFTEKAVRGEATGMVCGGLAEVFLEVVSLPPVLVICGGGPVGQAIARAGALAGFECVVADDRPAFRDPGLFPEQTELVAVDRDSSKPFLDPWRDRDLWVTVVSRCWETDTSALASILRQKGLQIRYLGLMGSARKIARVRDELESRGLSWAEADITAPIGLPIGGDTPGEIAIGVVAQLLERRYRKSRREAAMPERREPL